MKKINVLSLFGGIECGRVAMERLGWEIDTYFSSEIDPYAIRITENNYPSITHIGGVNDVSYHEGWLTHAFSNDGVKDYGSIPIEIDLLIGGSPCQDLSTAKANGQGLAGEKSGLFFEYVRILQETKPKYFLLENVASMKKVDKDEITRIMGVEPILINSALVSAQNRKRLYWTNIPGITQPEDKEIFLKDILEDIPAEDPQWRPLDEKYITDPVKLLLKEKAYALTATYPGACPRDYIEKASRQLIIGQFRRTSLRVHADQEKVCTLTANMGTGGNNVPIVLTPKSIDLQTIKNIIRLYLLTTVYASTDETNTNTVLSVLGESINKKEISEWKIGGIVSFYQKKVLQSDMYGDGIGCETVKINGLGNYPLPCEEDNEGGNNLRDMWKRECDRCSSSGWRPHEQGEKEFTETLQKLPQFTAQRIEEMQDMWDKTEMTLILREALPKIQEVLRSAYDSMGEETPVKYVWRKLTCIEAERLQTLPDGYTDNVSATRRYKAIGNGWTVDIIKHILSFAKF